MQTQGVENGVTRRKREGLQVGVPRQRYGARYTKRVSIHVMWLTINQEPADWSYPLKELSSECLWL